MRVGADRPWRQAWQDALYSPNGFYRREQPSAHFRTASHAAAPIIAAAISRLLTRHDLDRVVEVGCGAGELLGELAALQPTLDLVGVELRPRPGHLPAAVAFLPEVPELDDTPTLLLGWELLDNVPAAVAVVDETDCWREVLVALDGRESPGDPLAAADAQWCARWYPGAISGTRVEVGRSRDEFWRGLVEHLPRGLALAVDYGIDRPADTLTGFRSGRQCAPVPDGSCDLTAHVHWPSVEAAVSSRGPTRRMPQRTALAGLGITADRPPLDVARRNGAAYLTALQRFSTISELVDPDGLGGFEWLITEIG